LGSGSAAFVHDTASLCRVTTIAAVSFDTHGRLSRIVHQGIARRRDRSLTREICPKDPAGPNQQPSEPMERTPRVGLEELFRFLSETQLSGRVHAACGSRRRQREGHRRRGRRGAQRETVVSRLAGRTISRFGERCSIQACGHARKPRSVHNAHRRESVSVTRV
jgi:hypothetical protein